MNLSFCEFVTKEQIDELIHTSERRQLWKIYLKNDKLIVYSKMLNGAPIFSTSDARIYFDEDKAQSTFDWLSMKFGLGLEIR